MTGTGLRNIRKHFGWNQTELADLLDVCTVTVSRWENLDTVPVTIEYAVKFVAFQVGIGSISDL